MAGYTRQDTANAIANGNVIDADDLDAEFNAIEAGFNSSTGHNHDGTSGEGAPILVLGPAQDLVVSTTNVNPKTNNVLDLGTASIQYKNAYFDGTVNTDVLTVDQTTTLTGNVTTAADVSVGGNLTVTGNAVINGNLTFGNADTDTITIGADVASSIIPDADDTYDLGTSVKEWRNLYVDGTANIDSLVADTADINAGTIDGTVIGGASPAAITGTTIQATTGFTGNVTGNITGNVTGALTGNASTATALQTGRTIALTGDVTATGVTFDGTGNISLSTTIQPNSVALATDTTGNYVATIAGTANEVEVSGSGTENAAVTIGLPNSVSITNDLTVGGNLTVNGSTTTVNTTNMDVKDTLVALNSGASTNANDAGILINRGSTGSNVFMGWDESADKFTVGTTTATSTSTGNLSITPSTLVVSTLEGNVTGNLTGNATTATTLATSRTISLTGDVSGSASFNGGSNISITATVADDSHNHTIANIDSLQASLDTLQTNINGKEAIDAEILRADTDDNLTAGYTSTADSDGTKSSGTYTPTPTGGNLKTITNGGAFTLAASTAAGDYTMVIQVTNNASAGAITLSGFNRVSGDTITTTNGHDFFIYITKIGVYKAAHVTALQ